MLNVNVYFVPFPLWVVLLVKPGDPSDSTLCGVSPVLVQVQVTVVPTATVSTAGF